MKRRETIETIETTKSKVRDKLYHPSSLDGAGGVIILLHRAGRGGVVGVIILLHWVEGGVADSPSFCTWRAGSGQRHPPPTLGSLCTLGGRAEGEGGG